MALKRRNFLLGMSLSVAQAACGSANTEPSRPVGDRLLQSGKGPQTIVAFMPDTPQTREVWRGLCDELGQEFSVVGVIVERGDSAALIKKSFERYRPSAVVLMNNPTVSMYRSYTRETNARRVPAVVVMTSFLDGSALREMGAAGISYEVPLITAVTNLRRILSTPVDRVGVVHRSSLHGFVAREATLAAREKVVVVARPLGPEPNVTQIKSALRDIKQEADVVWILNDDRVLTPEYIAQGWLPGLNEQPFRPTIVSAASLVSSAQSFGTVALLPDHTALGMQTAELVFDIADNGWQLPEDRAQLPLSTNTVVDLQQAHDRFHVKADALEQVDRVVE